MIEITRATIEDAKLLAELARETFAAAHAPSAPAKDMEAYLSERLSIKSVENDLRDEKNLFYLLHFNGKLAGFSKLIPNTPNPKIESKNICTLDKLYFSKEFHDKKLGLKMLEFNLELAKKLKQDGVWLLVWIGNSRAIRFYERAGFKIVGETGFKISETHSNPNYWMYRPCSSTT